MAAPGVAVPGSVVAIGSQASPAGAQGIGGIDAVTTTSAGFTVPAVGSTVSVTVVNASWVVVGQMVYVDQAGGGVGLAGVLQVTAKAGNTLTLLNPQSVPAIPPADATQAGLLKQLSGNTTDFVDGTNACQPLQPVIWSVRLRSYSSVGNPNFECDQRNAGTSVTLAAGTVSSFGCDRWQVSKTAATGVMTAQKTTLTSGAVKIPGTNYYITNTILQLTVSIAQTTLAAGDFLVVQQFVEGPQLRELIGDVHSISLLIGTSNPLTFSVYLGAVAGNYSLVKLCSHPGGGYVLFTLPNLPVWTSSATWDTRPGFQGYFLGICLAAGSSWIGTPDTWQSKQNLAATGTSNWLATAGNTFSLAFVQHEPGQATTLMDVPFSQNYDQSLRYFCKSYPYTVKPGSVDSTGPYFVTPANCSPTFWIPYPKALAKSASSLLGYSSTTGTVNFVRDVNGAVDRGISSVPAQNEKGFSGFSTSPLNASNTNYQFHFTADTGW